MKSLMFPVDSVIIKAPASENVVSIDSDTIVYDGKSHQLDKATSKVAKGTTIYYRKQGSNEWTETMPSYTDAGTYPIEVKAENANYEDSFARGTLVIRRRPVTITGNSDTFTYNGKEQTIEGYTWTQQDGDTGLVNGQQITDVTAKASATNAGKNIAGTITQEKDVKILADGKDVSKNYLITTIPGSITITPKKVTITSADAEKKFNGQALIKHEISEEPELADGDQVKYSFTGMQTNIGTGKNTFTANFYKDGTMINSNYSVEYQYGELIVYGEINYDANGGTGEAPKPDRYDAGDTYEVKDNMFERKGYTFTGWNTSPDGSGVSYGKGAIINSLTNNQTLYAQWKADEDTAYTVEVYLEGEDGNYPEDPTYSYERTGTTGSVVKVTDKDLTAPDGYAYDPQANNITEGTVAGDGSLVLKIYFGKDEIGPDPDDGGDNIPDRYQILFTYVAKENGSVSGNVYEVHTFTTPDGEYTKPSAITPEAKVAASANPGYQISAWKDEDDTDLGNGEQPDFEGQRYATNQIFTASFEEKDEIQISYKAEDGGSVDNDQDVIRPATGKPEGSTASANPGYHFVGWYLNDEKVEDEENFVPEKNAQGIYEEATYVAKFAPNEDTKYVVERYFSDEDGNYSSTPDETLTYQGTTNTKVSISEKDQIPPEGYAFDPQADNVMEGSVAGDGSLVLKIYFGKDTIGPDPDDGGDGIPDRYQILFTYVAEDNGTVSGTTHELHTFVNDSGEYYEPTPIAPEANVIADSNDGYAIERWRDQNSNDLGNDVAPVFEEHKYSENHTFTVSFTELENVIISYEAQEGGSVNNPQDAINPETGDPQGSTATVNDGYEFEGWYLNDEKISDELTFVPTKNENGRYESATYVAHFSKVAVPVVEEEKPQTPDKPENSKGTDTAEQTKMGLYLSSMSSAGLLGLIMLLKRKKEEK